MKLLKSATSHIVALLYSEATVKPRRQKRCLVSLPEDEISRFTYCMNIFLSKVGEI